MQLRGRLAPGLLLAFVLLGTIRASPVFQQVGNTLVMSNADVCLYFNLTAGTTDFYWQNTRIISGFYSAVGLSTGYLKGVDYRTWSYSVSSSNQVVVTATGSGLPMLRQYFTLDQHDSFLVRVEVSGSNLAANWMGPLVVDATGGVFLGVTNDNRALVVPFDNDGFVSYNAMPINSSATGYEVGAFYDNTSRNGLVVGSVTHDTWKTGVFFSGANNNLSRLNVFGGATSPWDVVPHGSVAGNVIASPTVFVGFGADWRVTMRNYAAENTNVVPRLAWTNGVPFGWNSWGVMQQSINYTDAVAVSDYFYTNLMPNHFTNQGTVYLNLDSYWDNLSNPQLQSFVNHCHAQGEKAGIYWSPFVFWGTESQGTNWAMPGGGYDFGDAYLRTADGSAQAVDGGIALDPTHPGTKQMINFYVNEFTNWGFDYVKLDFLSHGALEGVHYDPNVTTGVAAYNQGMRYLCATIQGRMFISESIAPLFPYQYGHSRRIACDAGASLIANTAYTMNSVSYGWWLDGLYQFNDPDVMVFGNGADTNEMQSRLISCAVTGFLLDGDDLTSVSGQSGAQMCLTNLAINTVARTGQTFTPVEGNTGSRAEHLFVRQDGAAWHLAVFNYTSNSTNLGVSLSRAGLPAGYYTVSNLWDGTTMVVTGSFNASLNGKQSKLFSLTARSPQSLVWSASNSGTWDTDISANWINSSNDQQTVFIGGDQVVFNDAAGAPTNPVVNGTVQPSSVTVSAVTNNYTFNGPGTLATAGSFTKSGSSLLSLLVPAAITGPVWINGGSVYAGNYAFVHASSLTITNNATLDFAGGPMADGTPITVSGAGVGGEGALYNSSYETYDNLLYVTLAGNATFGGTSRWDLGPGSTVTGPYQITINRAPGVYGEWSGASLNVNVGDIELAGGRLGLKNMGSAFGNAAANFIVDPGTELDFWTGDPGYAKHFQVQSNGTLQILTAFANFAGNLVLENNSTFAAYGGNDGDETFGGTFTLNGVAHFMLGNGDFLFTNVISGAGGFVWDSFDHEMVFSAANTYTGPTVIGAGLTLALAGNGSISQSSLIFFGGDASHPASLDVSARSDGTLALGGGQTLGGAGAINGKLIVQSGATIAPGGTNFLLNLTNGASGTATLTASGSITLNGTSFLKLNASGASDEIASRAAITYGGVLSVANISGSPLAAGNNFQLFSAPAYNGAFNSITPATPGPGLSWDTAQLSSGRLTVVTAPLVTSVTLSGTNFIFTGTHGPLSGNYVVLSSTNLLTPLKNWPVLMTNAFDPSGNFQVTNVMSPGVNQRFYTVQPH